MAQNLVLHVNGPNGLVPLQVQTTVDGQEVLANLAVVSKIAQDYAKNYDRQLDTGINVLKKNIKK